MTKPKPKAVSRPAAPAMKPEWWRIEKIKPYPSNPRTHPPAQITLLAALLKRRGIDQPIVVDEDGVILKGHGRRLAAIEAGLTSFPVVQHRGMPESERQAMRIEDNQVALLSGWDATLIQSEIGDLKLAGYPLELLGFGDAQLVSFQTTPGPPSEFQVFGDDIVTEHECPKCGYRWSGTTAPASAPEPKKGRAK